MKKETIKQIALALLKLGKKEAEDRTAGMPDDALTKLEKDATMQEAIMVANEAVIYYKMAQICEQKGLEAAITYFTGTHDMTELEEFVGKVA